MPSYKILIIGVSWVGDMVLSQPLFAALKKAHPAAQIDVLSPIWMHELLARMRGVDNVLPFPIGHGPLALKQRYLIGKSLRAAAYDQAIVIPNSWKSALIPFFAKIPLRTGWLGEARYGLLNDWRKLDKIRYPLMIERLIALSLPQGADLPVPLPSRLSGVMPSATPLAGEMTCRGGVTNFVPSQ